LNIIGVAWTEGRYGNASDSRLNSMVRQFHPDIKVVHANKDLESDFLPLVYVPANFIFNSKGERVYGDGTRNPLDMAALDKFLKQLN